MNRLFQYIHTTFFLLSATILLTACEREVEIPLPPHEAKLVSNCIAVSERPFRVIVSRSFGMDEQVQEADIYLPDAQAGMSRRIEEGAEYYDHIDSRRFIDLDLSVLSKTPLPISSNAEGGFGIFGGYTVRTDTLFF